MDKSQVLTPEQQGKLVAFWMMSRWLSGYLNRRAAALEREISNDR